MLNTPVVLWLAALLRENAECFVSVTVGEVEKGIDAWNERFGVRVGGIEGMDYLDVSNFFRLAKELVVKVVGTVTKLEGGNFSVP